MRVSLLSPMLFVFSLPCQADDETRSATQKERETWKSIVETRYVALPEVISPSTWDALSLLDAEYDSKAFAHDGDKMIEGRAKLIHGFGTAALVSFVADPHSPFTGLFSAGAPFGLIRVSLAAPHSSDTPPHLVPGLAIKFFVDGKSSLNIMAMPSLDGQNDSNIFSLPYTTDLGEPNWSFKTWLLENRFTSALGYVGQPDGNPRSLSLDHFASMTSMGEKVVKPVAPFSLMLVPSKTLQDMIKASCESDFRVCLEGKGNGITLFDVYAPVFNEQNARLIGTVVAKSHFVASKFADQTLFFKHPRVHTWSESTLRPEL